MRMFAALRKKGKREQRRERTAASESLEAAKLACKKATQAVDAAKLVVMMEGAKAFELYGNLLSDEARQPWEKIIQAIMT